ncbi:MAG TPA: phosphoenolpyruvate carboxykinase [Caldisericia bacterium]|nr:phosphoenolpyruvate carboxykinase [Caldisericia bacterium]HPF49589.1 phosphoenolpyruvate carboxykinase [Caldisericia bacterium]HPI84495.1 phosphoenolpyruvate carboxykinase [Caldisericia bacterium]HPQ93861.1 phosphoenolpyruvate carboxykinase [Caldisericia bacterium]HRV75406.1 phosphoenolpyruvate carboxykinase [Caldisericia bacterium]
MDIFTKPLKVGKLLSGLSSEELFKLASHDIRKTEYSSDSFVSRIRSRSAAFTEIVGVEPTPEQAKLLLEVRKYLEDKEVIKTEMTMHENPKYQIPCELYVTKPFARLPYTWQKLLFPPRKIEGVKPIKTIVVPEWPERKILVSPHDGVTVSLGTDYFGEVKKSFLRMAIYRAKLEGNLGLHAGSKMIRVKNKDGKLVEKGIILFGLSGTGKTTLTCHHHFLEGEEGVAIRQDDMLVILPDTTCIGTEHGFYIKTEGLEGVHQPVLFHAATANSAIFENIWVTESGKVDFMNYTYTTNGRCVVQRKDIEYTDNTIDLPHTDMMVLITRRYDIIPAVAKLSPAQAAAFFMLGESIETSAGDPTKAGQAKRCVGTNPFIVGPKDDEGNYIMNLLKNNPNMECFLLNTGKIGEKEKVTIKDSVGILKSIASGKVEWKKDPYWGYEVLESCDGVDVDRLDPSKYYHEDELKSRNDVLRKERRDWLNKFPMLDQEIQDAI